MIDPKEYLSQIRAAEIRLEQLTDEQDSVRTMAEHITAGTGGAGGSGGVSDRVGNAAAKLADLAEVIAIETAELAETRRRIISEIQSLEDDRYVQLLYKRYVEYKRLERIACEMNYNFDTIRHLHGYALIAFGKQILTHKNT